METSWFRTDELNELKDSIHFADLHISEYLQKGGHIKWPIIATANALQCACVLFIDGNDTTGLDVLSQSNRKKWLKEYNSETDENLPIPFLAKPIDLYKIALNTQKLPYHAERLFELRNDFIHFTPKGMSIEVSGLKKLLHSCWKDISQILAKPRMYEHRYDDNDISYINETAAKILQLLN